MPILKAEEVKPFSWSYSKLSCYEKCPAQYRYRYVDGLKTEKAAAASRGTEIHASIENYMLGKAGVEGLHESVTQYSGMFAGIKAKKPHIEEKLAISASWGIVPWAEGWGRLVVDSYYVEKREIIVQEWKSGKVYDDHEDQRRLYGAVLYQLYPDAKRAEVKTIYTDQGKALKLELLPEDVPEIIQDFDRRVDFLVSDNELAPRPGWYCSRFCSFSRMKGGPCKVG